MNSLSSILSDGRRLEVRPMSKADIEPIVRIRRDERLRELQYPPSNSFNETLTWKVEAYEKSPHSNCPYRAVVIDGVTIGDIFSSGWKRRLTYSWNLHPEYWGNGIMAKALELVFVEQFANTANLVIRADCFPNNNQSRRLMEKLGFQQIVHSRFWQLFWDIFSLHSRKVKRFRLCEAEFEKRSIKSKGQITTSTHHSI